MRTHYRHITVTLFICLLVGLGLVPAQSQSQPTNARMFRSTLGKSKIVSKALPRFGSMKCSSVRDPAKRLTLQIEVSFSTEKETKPKDAKLIFKSQAPRLRLYQGQEAIFLADGNRIRSITATDDMADQFGMSTRFEKKNVVVAYEDFAKIANAESVEMQLGAVETKFDQKVMRALRNFVLCAFKIQNN